MATSKGAVTLKASGSNAAGATTNSSSLNMTTYPGAVVTAQITNGATAPTVPCSAIVQVSSDGTTWHTWAQGTAGLTASTAYSFSWEIPPPVMYVNVKFTGNTDQAVTVAAQAQYVAGL